MLSPTAKPTCTPVLEWAGLATAVVVADGLGLVPDVDVGDEVGEGAVVLAVVAGTASAEETAGPIVRRLLGSWQHWPVPALSQQNGVVVELQGNASGKASKAKFSESCEELIGLSKTTYLRYRNSGKQDL